MPEPAGYRRAVAGLGICCSNGRTLEQRYGVLDLNAAEVSSAQCWWDEPRARDERRAFLSHAQELLRGQDFLAHWRHIDDRRLLFHDSGVSHNAASQQQVNAFNLSMTFSAGTQPNLGYSAAQFKSRPRGASQLPEGRSADTARTLDYEGSATVDGKSPTVNRAYDAQ